MHIVCEPQRRCSEFFGALKLLCASAGGTVRQASGAPCQGFCLRSLLPVGEEGKEEEEEKAASQASCLLVSQLLPVFLHFRFTCCWVRLEIWTFFLRPLQFWLSRSCVWVSPEFAWFDSGFLRTRQLRPLDDSIFST